MRGWCSTQGCGWRGSYRYTTYGEDRFGHDRPLSSWKCIGCYFDLPSHTRELFTYVPPPGDEVEMLNRHMSDHHHIEPIDR